MDSPPKRNSQEIRPILRLSRQSLNLATEIKEFESTDLDLESFLLGRDEERFLKLNNEIFHDHHDQGGWDIEKLRTRMAEPWFHTENLLFVKKNESDIGYFWLKELHLENEGVCEIFVIGILPLFQGQGLGKKVLTLAIRQIIRNGFNEAWVYTDKSNNRALKLYRSFGFKVDLER